MPGISRAGQTISLHQHNLELGRNTTLLQFYDLDDYGIQVQNIANIELLQARTRATITRPTTFRCTTTRSTESPRPEHLHVQYLAHCTAIFLYRVPGDLGVGLWGLRGSRGRPTGSQMVQGPRGQGVGLQVPRGSRGRPIGSQVVLG